MKSNILSFIVLVCAAGLACSEELNPLSMDSKEAFSAIERLKANGDYKTLLIAVEKSSNSKVRLMSIRAMKDCDAEANASLVDILEKAASDEMLIGNLESMHLQSEKVLALSEVIADNLKIPRPQMEPRQMSPQGRILLPAEFAKETVDGFVQSARQKLEDATWLPAAAEKRDPANQRPPRGPGDDTHVSLSNGDYVNDSQDLQTAQDSNYIMKNRINVALYAVGVLLLAFIAWLLMKNLRGQ